MGRAADQIEPGDEGPARAGGRARVVQDFARAARGAIEPAQLRSLLCQAVRALGFDYLLLQGGDGQAWLAELPPPWRTPRPGGEADAVLAAAAMSYTPFLWSDIPRLTDLSQPQRDYLSEAVAAGVGASITFPVHRHRPANEGGSHFAGLVSFLMRSGLPLPMESLAAAHYVAEQGFDAAERLRHAAPRIFGPLAPRLTPRQRDCVVLVAQGKSDWEIGRLLGISESTVHKHIEDAKRRFAVCTRIQLVVRSLFDARLSFADVIDVAPPQTASHQAAAPQTLASSTCTTSVLDTAKVAAQIPR